MPLSLKWQTPRASPLITPIWEPRFTKEKLGQYFRLSGPTAHEIVANPSAWLLLSPLVNSPRKEIQHMLNYSQTAGCILLLPIYLLTNERPFSYCSNPYAQYHSLNQDFYCIRSREIQVKTQIKEDMKNTMQVSNKIRRHVSSPNTIH